MLNLNINLLLTWDTRCFLQWFSQEQSILGSPCKILTSMWFERGSSQKAFLPNVSFCRRNLQIPSFTMCHCAKYQNLFWIFLIFCRRLWASYWHPHPWKMSWEAEFSSFLQTGYHYPYPFHSKALFSPLTSYYGVSINGFFSHYVWHSQSLSSIPLSWYSSPQTRYSWAVLCCSSLIFWNFSLKTLKNRYDGKYSVLTTDDITKDL